MNTEQEREAFDAALRADFERDGQARASLPSCQCGGQMRETETPDGDVYSLCSVCGWTPAAAPVPAEPVAWHAMRTGALMPHSQVVQLWPTAEDKAHAALEPLFRAATPPQAAAPAGRQTEAACDVLAERQRQVSVEDWAPGHDDEHVAGELALAAVCYALPPHQRYVGASPFRRTPTFWPWAGGWKPKDARSDLIRAGALILAEIERLDRLAAQQEAPSPASPSLGERVEVPADALGAPASPSGSGGFAVEPQSVSTPSGPSIPGATPAWMDETALAAAREISLMWGQDRSHFVSKIQCAVLDAMRHVEAAMTDAGVPHDAELRPHPAPTYTAEHFAGQLDQLALLRIWAKAVISHWDEFGPEHGFDEAVEMLRRAL